MVKRNNAIAVKLYFVYEVRICRYRLCEGAKHWSY
jgi:hypothetical protein